MSRNYSKFDRLALKRAGDTRVSCIHCKKEVPLRSLKLWHGDNCAVVKPRVPKEKPVIDESLDDVHTKMVRMFLTYLNLNEKRKYSTSESLAQATRASLRELRSLAHDRSEEIHNTRKPVKGKCRINEKIKCEHCGKETNLQNHIKWHGDNCRNK
jgi:hypothetical protein